MIKRNVLFASWAFTAVAGTLWACSASITAPDLGSADGGDTPDGSMSMNDDSSVPGDDSGTGGDTAMMGETGGEAGEAVVCGATATYDLCTACCDMFHPGGSDVIPNTAYDCTCMKGGATTAQRTATRLRECANQCAASYCNDAGITAPTPGDACDICLGKALAGDAGDASAGAASRPGDCLGPAFSACAASPACVGYEKCYAAANCGPKP
ncbi:MAG: hypothetical protein ABIP89_21665 [Polyangiaceae bacterium]